VNEHYFEKYHIPIKEIISSGIIKIATKSIGILLNFKVWYHRSRIERYVDQSEAMGQEIKKKIHGTLRSNYVQINK